MLSWVFPSTPMDATPSRLRKQSSQLALAQVKDIAGLLRDMAGKAGNLLGSSAVAPHLHRIWDRTWNALGPRYSRNCAVARIDLAGWLREARIALVRWRLKKEMPWPCILR